MTSGRPSPRAPIGSTRRFSASWRAPRSAGSSMCRAICRPFHPATSRRADTPLRDPAVDIGTARSPRSSARTKSKPIQNVVGQIGSPLGDNHLRALYFTRATALSGDGPRYHHIGRLSSGWRCLPRCRDAAAPHRWSAAKSRQRPSALEAGMRIDAGSRRLLKAAAERRHSAMIYEMARWRWRAKPGVPRKRTAQTVTSKTMKIAFQGEWARIYPRHRRWLHPQCRLAVPYAMVRGCARR